MRVQQLTHEGLPKRLRGRYDVDSCTTWYIKYLQALVAKKAFTNEDGEVRENERSSRLRLLCADADLKEMQLARERGQLVAVQDVEKEMSELVIVVKARVMAVGARVAPEVVGEMSRVMAQAKVEKSLREALAQLEKVEAVRDDHSM
jgi:phage terminase Nu1 subunit (DNA packaging protein)